MVIEMTKTYPQYKVTACKNTGEWTSEPVFVADVEVSAWNAKTDTDDAHFDTYEVNDQTRAIEVVWDTVAIRRVNEKGWRLIKEWIAATANEEHEFRTDSAAAEAWCSEAEESMGNGNPPMVEMPGNATKSGNPETFTVPEDCIYTVYE